MLIKDYHQFGGKHYETATVRNVLAHRGLTAPHTGQPFSEELLFGLGSGLGMTYFVFEFSNVPTMYIGTRYHLELAREICKRLGLTIKVQETTGAKGAEKQLKLALEQGNPVIAWCDLASLPYFALPASLIKMAGHMIVVYGFEEEQVYVADTTNSALTITPEILAASRIAMTAQKNRIMTIEPPAQIENLKDAVLEAIRANCRFMLEPSLANFGLKALPKWAALITNSKDKKGWPKLFPAGPHLYEALKNIYFYIESYGVSGGFRLMYAQFLQEASAITGLTSLKEVADQYCELGQKWNAFASAALPDEVPLFKETKELYVRKRQLFQEQGQKALSEMQQIEARLRAVKDEASETFPLTQAEIDDLLAELQRHILGLSEGETQALTALHSLTA